MRPVDQVTAVNAEGLKDDISLGRSKRQVLIIELETLCEFNLKPGDVRENIVVAGLSLAGTAPHTHIHLGSVEMEVTTDCAPCEYLDSLRPGLQQKINGRRGTLCRVIRGGVITIGDRVTIVSQSQG